MSDLSHLLRSLAGLRLVRKPVGKPFRAIRSRAFRPIVAGLEARVALSLGDALPPSAVPTEKSDQYAVQRHQENLARVRTKHDDVVFFGDSMVDFWSKIALSTWNQKIAPFGAANFGVASDFTQSLLWRLENGELAGRPRVAVVEIGTNNLLFGNPSPAGRVEDTVAGIGAVVSTIQKLSPGTQILLMGVFPQGEQPDDPLRLDVQRVNGQIAKLADGVKVRFLDISSIFLQADGTRPATTYGIHPTPQQYVDWADAIHGPVQQMLGRPTAPAVQDLRFLRPSRSIVLTFNESLEMSSAQNPSNYALTRERRVTPRGLPRRARPVVIKHLDFDPTERTTTLVLSRPPNPGFRYLLTVNGASPSGIRDLFGIYLAGVGDGQPGKNFVAEINPSKSR